MSITVKELKELLNEYPDDYDVYMSSDEEGNSYGGITREATEVSKIDSVVVFYPSPERLEYDEIFPKEWEQESDDDRDI